MANGSLARRYARALVSLGQEAGSVDQMVQDLDTFDEVLGLGDGTLRQALCNPGLTNVERKAILEDVLKRLSLHKHIANFLRLLVDKNRFEVLGDIRKAIHEMADELAGRVRATVRTAHALDAAMAKTVQAALEQTTGKQVIVDFVVDSTLIGGMVAQVGDLSYDASIRTRLESLQQSLIRNPGALTAEA